MQIVIVMMIWRYVLAIALSIACISRFSEARCLDGFTSNGTTKRFTIKDQPTPLTIYVGTSISSKIAGHVVSILLGDVLGYGNVELLTDSSPGPLTVKEVNAFVTKKCINDRVQCIPPAIIYPAVWVPVDYHPSQSTTRVVRDVGSLGLTGSYGWYISTAFVQQIWKTHRIPADHWRGLQVPDIVGKLLSTVELESLNEKCRECVSRVFYPKICDPTRGGERSLCALLLAQYRGSCSTDMERQITSLELHVAVAWLNTQPNTLVMKYESREKPVLFATFEPDALTTSGRFTQIQFPNCKSQSDLTKQALSPHPTWNCSCSSTYELRKFAWSHLKSKYNDIVKLLSRIVLQQNQVSEIIQRARDSDVSKTVCDWLVQNKKIWLPWIPMINVRKKKICIGGMFPSLTGPEAVWTSPGDELGAIMAMESVNEETAVLKDYELNIPTVATQCRRELVLNAYISYLNSDPSRRVVGILGPGCSKPTLAIAAVSHYHNMVVMGYGADDVSLSDRKRYPYFFRTVPSVDEFKFAYVALFYKFNWKRCVTLRGTRYPTSTVLSHTQYLTSKGIDVVSRVLPTDKHLHASAYVSSVKKSGQTIIILEAYPEVTRAIVCEACRQGLYPSKGYVWFLLGWLHQDWWDTGKHSGNATKERVPCTSEEMKKFVDQGYFSLSGSFYGEDDEVIVGGGTVKRWRKEYAKRAIEKKVNPSEYASLAYDAVWTYALALDKLVKNSSHALDHIFENKTSRLFQNFIQQTYFAGVSGFVHFRNGDRITNVIIIKQNFATSSTVIGRFVPETSQDHDYKGTLKLDENAIIWESGEVPSDSLRVVESEAPVTCAVESLRSALGVSCAGAGFVAAAIALFIVCTVLCFVFWILKGRYSSKYRIIKTRLTQLGLLDAQAASAIFVLDAWELPRDNIVLNRKLGEGAFGAVFGGEGYDIENQASSISVAVKTLKTGARVEEKFEFLGEAETMKHFSHENIVRLFGVCTKSEPAFIVMELMIHGDLKSFLLARRRLIDQHGTPEAEEVTSSNLTKMALDIARGLQYLSQMKYVHRDLALRNCMVGLGNVIKIGDFGLARKVNIKDYYRFERKGALPIRWMSPESISEGLFTTQSDVWSYGVGMWELATFGGFPYQGATNPAVLEYVKDGNTLEIPQHSSDQMASLLRMCWRFDYLDRPTPYRIVQILTENPELVNACVEVPPTTVSDDSTGRFYAPNTIAHGRNSRVSRTSSISSQMSERFRVSGLVKESTSLPSRRPTAFNSSPGMRKTSFFFKL